MTIISDQMGLAIRLARSGAREQAHSPFSQIVDHSPEEAEAWLWLSELSDSLDDQVAALDRAVECIDAMEGPQSNLQERLNAIREVVAMPPRTSQEAPETDLMNVTLPEEDEGAANALAPLAEIEDKNSTNSPVVHTTALQWAERLIILGEKGEAEHLLRAMLDEDPDSIEAVTLLCEIVERPEEKKRLLERILVLDPDNQDAALQIESLDKQIHASPRQRTILEKIADELSHGVKFRPFAR